MLIDITARLREVLLVGLPVALAGCSGDGHAVATDPSALIPSPDPSCAVRNVAAVGDTSKEPVGTVAYDPRDIRFADLHEGCVEEGLYCRRLCEELLINARFPSYYGGGLSSCQIGCDAAGSRIAVVRYSTAVPGRRPEGFTLAADHGPGTSIGRWCAQAALFEGASVAAFERLALELAAHGAPRALVTRARAAARDEARHFRAMKRLAARFGVTDVTMPAVAIGPARSLDEVACENAEEGCVSETFAALVSLHQGRHAADRAARAALARIAEDELRHAQLAWDVDEWARTRLDGATGDALARRRAEAGRALADGAAAEVDPTLTSVLGLPDRRAAAALAAGLRDGLWAA